MTASPATAPATSATAAPDLLPPALIAWATSHAAPPPAAAVTVPRTIVGSTSTRAGERRRTTAYRATAPSETATECDRPSTTTRLSPCADALVTTIRTAPHA